MFKLRKKLVFLWILPILFLVNILCSQAVSPPSPFSIAALTWNVGNQTVKDKIVKGFGEEIKKLRSPDVIVVGTQEELAKNGEELKDKLKNELEFQSKGLYNLAAEKAYTTTAGANNSPKTLAFTTVQNTVLSKAANLPKNRCTLAIFVKKGIVLEGRTIRIDHSPKKQNNAFILIEGNLVRGGQSLPVSIASVHLDSKSDAIRRVHANSFFEKQGFANTSKMYQGILAEAKRFHLVMGDFNERDYLMKDNTVTDRGYLTNFTGYGYDFPEPQGRKSIASVYGTYGYTKLNNATPEVIKDPRGRTHNAKGGFLDRIAMTSGLPIVSPSAQYGALVTDKQEFDPKKKLFYAGSDHLPVVRYFMVNIPDINDKEDTAIVKRYIERRLPDFQREIKAIEAYNKNPGQFAFYDSQEPSNEFINNLEERKKGLEGLQGNLKLLKEKVNGSQDHAFLSGVYNQITDCNKHRNLSLEKMDDTASGIEWYFPNSLGQDDFQCYQAVLKEALKPASK